MTRDDPGELRNPSTFSQLSAVPIPPHRQLTVDARSGLCNRLKVLLSGLAIAEATGRGFAMRWSDRSNGCAFDRLFQNQWNVRSDISIDEPRLIDLTIRPWRAFPDLLMDQSDHLVVRHHDWLILPARYPSHSSLHSRCKALIDELTPIPFIEQRVQSFRAYYFRSKVIGVHLRRGDLVLHRPDTVGNLLPAMQIVDRWLDEFSEAGILLCTDDGADDPFSPRKVPREGVVDKFVERYGERVITTKPRSLDRHTPEAIEDGLVDLQLLRLTDFFVGTSGSSFSEMAMFGRAVPAELTAAPTPHHAGQARRLRVSGISYFLSRASQSEFGYEVPYNMILRRYKLRFIAFIKRIAQLSFMRRRHTGVSVR